MWKSIEIESGKEYRIWLCQSGTVRTLKLQEDGFRPPDGVAATGIVPHAVLIEGDVSRLAEEVSLEDGRAFFVDAHGVWLMKAEWDAIRAGIDIDCVPWEGGVRPGIASK